MGLRRVEAPEEDVVSLEAMKRHLRIAEDETEFDDEIAAFTAAAVDLLDGAAGQLQRCLAPQTWEYVLDAFPDGPFQIPLPPLLEVEAISYVDSEGDLQTLTEDEDYRVDEVSEPGWVSPVEGWPSTLDTINAVTVRFRAGYESDGTSGNSPIPPRAQQAVKLIVGHWFANRETVNIGNITSELPLSAQTLINSLRVFA